MRIAVRYQNQGEVYFDKTFLERFGENALGLYGFTTCDVPEECFDDFTSDDFSGLVFDPLRYTERKNKENNELQIKLNLARMEELSKDFVQYSIGASIDDIDVKKQEFVRLHNEVRYLQGKTPRNYNL